jgi:hypothetical protein
MFHFLRQGGLQHSHDPALRKVPSQMDFARNSTGSFNSMTSPRVPVNHTLALQPSPPRSRRGPPGLSPGIPEGRSTDGANGAADGEDPPRLKDLHAQRERRQEGLPAMRMFTFLRMTSDLTLPASRGAWMYFMNSMKGYQPALLCD